MINLKIFQFFLSFMYHNIFGTLKPKLELPKITMPCGRPSELENSMFFALAGLNMNQNLKKITHVQISTYLIVVHFKSLRVLQTRIHSKFQQISDLEFSVSINFRLRGSILGSNFLMCEKYGYSALTEKK